MDMSAAKIKGAWERRKYIIGIHEESCNNPSTDTVSFSYCASRIPVPGFPSDAGSMFRTGVQTYSMGNDPDVI